MPETNNPTTITSILSWLILMVLFLLVLNDAIINFFHQKRRQSGLGIYKHINQIMITVLIGMITGFYFKFSGTSYILNELKGSFYELFLIILLPPMLFQSAISIEKSLLFENFGAICLYGIIGSLIATFTTTILMYFLVPSLPFIYCAAFGALSSSTDTFSITKLFDQFQVNQTIFALIVGESVLNDSISFIVFGLMQDFHNSFFLVIFNFFYQLIGSLLIGYSIGLLCGHMIRKYNSQDESNRQSTQNTEITIMIITPWLSYLVAQVFNVTGRGTIIFCAISMFKNSVPYFSEGGKTLVTKFFYTIAYNSGNLIFLVIGISLIGLDLNWKDVGFFIIFWAIIAMMIGRFLNIFIISRLVNKICQEELIAKKSHFCRNIMWLCSLRGVTAFAIAIQASYIFDQGQLLLTLTLCILVINIYGTGVMAQLVIEEDENGQSLLFKRLRELKEFLVDGFQKFKEQFLAFIIQSFDLHAHESSLSITPLLQIGVQRNVQQ